jgi:hypothetical protein
MIHKTAVESKSDHQLLNNHALMLPHDCVDIADEFPSVLLSPKHAGAAHGTIKFQFGAAPPHVLPFA